MVKNNKIAILIVITCTVLTSLGQLFLKKGTYNISFEDIIYNYWLFAGLIMYSLGAVLFILALKFGDLSLVYPIISLSFVWVALLSFFFLNESLSVSKLTGIPLILTGVCLIGVGGKNG